MKNIEEQSDFVRNYAHSLNQTRLGDGNTLPDILERIRQKTKPFFMHTHHPDIDYQSAKDIFKFTAQSLCSRQQQNFIIDNENSGVLQNLVAYFIQDQANCVFSIQKGIYLYGPVGVGKTFIFQIFQLFCQAILCPTYIIKPTRKIVQNVEKAKSFTGLEKYQDGIICFDDLGKEPKTLKIYHHEESIMSTVLSDRYEAFISRGLLTHTTSNLVPSELEAEYGTYISDRCRQLFNFVALGDEKSKSRRS